MNINVKLIEKHPALIRFCHWLNVALVSLYIWSGLLIYWANQAYVEIPDLVATNLRIEFRLAEGMGWHFFLIFPFILNGLVYVVYLLVSKEWRHLFPNKSDFKNIIPIFLYELKLKKSPVEQLSKYNAIQKLAYLGIIVVACGSIISGLAIYKPVQLAWIGKAFGGYQGARLAHFVFMCCFCLFIFIHVMQVLRAGWNNFRSMVAGYEIHKDE